MIGRILLSQKHTNWFLTSSEFFLLTFKKVMENIHSCTRIWNKIRDPLEFWHEYHLSEQNAVWAPNVELVSYKEILVWDVYSVNINTNLKLQELTSTAESYIALQKYKDYDRTKEGRHPTIKEKNTAHFYCRLIWLHIKSTDWFIEDQAFSPSYDLAPPPPPPLSRQQVVSLS